MFYPKPEKALTRAQRRRRDPDERVSPEERRHVLLRDGQCFAYRVDGTHVCRDRWARSHSPFALDMLTIEHVKRDLRAGDRALSKRWFMVALCDAENLRPPSATLRQKMRDYLSDLYPDQWTRPEPT